MKAILKLFELGSRTAIVIWVVMIALDVLKFAFLPSHFSWWLFAGDVAFFAWNVYEYEMHSRRKLP